MASIWVPIPISHSDFGKMLTELQVRELKEMTAIYRYITGYRTKYQWRVSLKLMTHYYICEFMLSLPVISLLIRLEVHILMNVENIKNKISINWEANEITIITNAKFDVIEDFNVLFKMKNSKKLCE